MRADDLGATVYFLSLKQRPRLWQRLNGGGAFYEEFQLLGWGIAGIYQLDRRENILLEFFRFRWVLSHHQLSSANRNKCALANNVILSYEPSLIGIDNKNKQCYRGIDNNGSGGQPAPPLLIVLSFLILFPVGIYYIGKGVNGGLNILDICLGWVLLVVGLSVRAAGTVHDDVLPAAHSYGNGEFITRRRPAANTLSTARHSKRGNGPRATRSRGDAQ